MSEQSYREINSGKEDFDDIYNCPDPRPYFRELGAYDYAIPREARPVFQSIVEMLCRQRSQESTKILDLGCSYGLNGAMLKRQMEWGELCRFFGSGDGQSSQAAKADSSFFAGTDCNDDLQIIGLDIADKAVSYAVETGLVDDGIVANLEDGSLESEDAIKLSHTDLIISTGCVGYVSDATFDKILGQPHYDNPPWIASFVLRMFPYDRIAERLEEHGLITEKLDGQLFFQRNFSSDDERFHTLSEIEKLGIDPAPERQSNCLFSELYLSRPRYEAMVMPLSAAVGI